MAVLTIRNRHPELAVAFAAGPIQRLGWGVSKQSPMLAAEIAAFAEAQTNDPGSDLSQLWRLHLGLTLAEFGQLVRTLPGG